jgi:hypothetical protein
MDEYRAVTVEHVLRRQTSHASGSSTAVVRPSVRRTHLVGVVCTGDI